MAVRLLAVLLLLAGALGAAAPAGAGASGGGEPAVAHRAGDEEPRPGEPEPADPEPIPDFWSVEEPASGSGGAPSGGPQPADATSTSPGGTEPAPGTATGPGAPASVATPAAGAERSRRAPACDPRPSLRRALRSLRRALRGRNLLAVAPRPIPVRVSSCTAGTLVLAVVLEDGGTVLWRARRTLAAAGRATLRLRMTAAGRRFIARAGRGRSRTVRMTLRARLRPPAR